MSKLQEIRSLNEHEKNGLREALEHYIAAVGEKRAWVQKILLAEMLDDLMWRKDVNHV